MKTILDVRKQIQATLRNEGIDSTLYPGLVTDLASIAIQWADVRIRETLEDQEK